MYDLILFDLDGTLTDPYEGITNSIVYALNMFGITVADKRTLMPFIGPPLHKSFKEVYGFGEADSYRAVEYYREYFAAKGIFENGVYDGVASMLDKLKSRNKTLFVATSKPEIYTNKILEHYGISGYFDFVAAATMDSSRVEKTDIISYALKNCSIKDKSRAVMVGDRKHDILGAKDNGLRSIGVLYGYGGRQELEAAGADYIVGSPSEIVGIVG